MPSCQADQLVRGSGFRSVKYAAAVTIVQGGSLYPPYLSAKSKILYPQDDSSLDSNRLKQSNCNPTPRGTLSSCSRHTRVDVEIFFEPDP